MTFERARAGDRGAWDLLVARYTPMMRCVARRTGLPDADVADVVQTVWIRLFERSAAVRHPACLPGWLKTATHREAVTTTRRRRHDVLDDATRAVPGAGDTTGPEEQAMLSELRDRLGAALAALPPQRSAVVRLVAGGMSYAEVSARTGLPIGSNGPTWGRSVERLRASSAVRRLSA